MKQTGSGGGYGELRWSVASLGEIASRLRHITRRLKRPGAAGARSLSASVVCLAGAAIVIAVLLFAFDANISRSVRTGPAGPRAFLDYLTDVGLILWYFYPALTISILLLATKFAPPNLKRQAHLHRAFVHSAYLAASLGIATSITHALKWLFGRARPPLLDEEGALGFEMLRMGTAFESFPSGHSTNVGVIALILAVWFPSLRWPVLIGGAALALTRIVVEAHFASDVVAGFAIGALTALCLGRYLARRRIGYRVANEGTGWRGLLPVRPSLGPRA